MFSFAFTIIMQTLASFQGCTDSVLLPWTCYIKMMQCRAYIYVYGPMENCFFQSENASDIGVQHNIPRPLSHGHFKVDQIRVQPTLHHSHAPANQVQPTFEERFSPVQLHLYISISLGLVYS